MFIPLTGYGFSFALLFFPGSAIASSKRAGCGVSSRVSGYRHFYVAFFRREFYDYFDRP
jgi:hypothetical protein